MFKSLSAVIILFSIFYSPNLWSSEDYNNCILKNMKGTVSDVAAQAIIDVCTIKHFPPPIIGDVLADITSDDELNDDQKNNITKQLRSILGNKVSLSFFDKSTTICVETFAKVTNDIIYLKNIAEPFSGENYCRHLNGLPKSRGDIQDGKRNNKWLWWNKNGNIGLEINYIEGKKNGKVIKWYKDQDDLIEPISLKGQIESEENYKDDKKDGQSIEWYPNGQIQLKENYKDDKKDGQSIKWYPDGEIQSKENYKDDKKDGKSTVWYRSGQIAIEENYKDDKKDGQSIEWYSSGQLGLKENYKDDKKDGQSIKWYPDGQIKNESIYKNDLCISGNC